jgi:hypothetical protein
VELYNVAAINRIKAAYPTAAVGLVKLIHAVDEHNAGSGEIALRYDKPEDKCIGRYEVMLVMRVQERGER